MESIYNIFNTYISNVNNEDEENVIAQTLLANFEITQEEMEERGYVGLRESLGKSFIEKNKKIKSFLKNHLDELGINSENIYFRPVYLIDGDINNSATTHNHKIELNKLPIDDNEIMEISYLTALAHEYYHCTGSIHRRAERSQYGDMKKLHINRAGARLYSKKHTSESSACEEGMAVAFETKAFDYICALYTKETVDRYLKVQEKFCNIMKQRVENTDTYYDNPKEFIIRKLDQTNKKIDACKSYPDALVLINYLKAQIPDFEKKMEEFRIKGNFLPLARSIDRIYGKGIFKELVLLDAYDEDSIAIFIKKLKNKGEE